MMVVGEALDHVAQIGLVRKDMAPPLPNTNPVYIGIVAFRKRSPANPNLYHLKSYLIRRMHTGPMMLWLVSGGVFGGGSFDSPLAILEGLLKTWGSSGRPSGLLEASSCDPSGILVGSGWGVWWGESLPFRAIGLAYCCF